MAQLLVVVYAYLLGSIPVGYLIVRAKERADVRQTGSGGTGATNVTRRAGKAAGIATLVLDGAKGFVAVALAERILGTHGGTMDWWVGAAALAALIGHIFPVWLRFRGGKGVATGLGIFLYLSPLAVAFSMALFALVVIATRYVSLGSILAAGTLPVWLWLLHDNRNQPLLVTAALGGLLIILMHHANIKRLLASTENKLK